MKNKMGWVISIFFLILAPILGILHQIKGGGPSGSPSVDALCPFGGLETIYSLITKGEYLKRIEPSALLLLAVIIVLTVLFGRVFCGLICPLGTMQKLMNMLAKFLHIKQIKLNTRLDRILRKLKYLVLIVVLLLTYKIGELIIRPYDPWAAFMHLSSGSEVFSEFLAGIIILAAILFFSMFIERAWCRYLCPLGAALAIISPLSIFKIKRDSKSCIGCKVCTRNCPVGLEIHSTEKQSKTECISCGECALRCPVNGTLQFKRKNIALSPNKLAAITIAIMVLITGTFIVSSSFKTSLSNSEVLMQEGNLSTENIKGYMTFFDICTEFNISSDKLLNKLNLPLDTDLNKPIKDLFKEEGLQFEVENVRSAVKELTK